MLTNPRLSGCVMIVALPVYAHNREAQMLINFPSSCPKFQKFYFELYQFHKRGGNLGQDP